MSNLTAARRKGLEALLHAHPAAARESNVTDVNRGRVYWQTARWLVDEGLAYYPTGSAMLMLTERGLAVARDL